MIIRDRSRLPQGMLSETIHEEATLLEYIDRMLVTKITRDVRLRDDGVEVCYNVQVRLEGIQLPPAGTGHEGNLIYNERIDDTSDLDNVIATLRKMESTLGGFAKACGPLDSMGVEMEALMAAEEKSNGD